MGLLLLLVFNMVNIDRYNPYKEKFLGFVIDFENQNLGTTVLKYLILISSVDFLDVSLQFVLSL